MKQDIAEIAVRYEVDERGLFCRHCGRATWLHNLTRGVGYTCVLDEPAHLLAHSHPEKRA